MDFFGFEFDDVKPKPRSDNFGFKFDADNYNNETEKFHQEVKTLKPAFDQLVAEANSTDNFDFELDPLDSLISEKGFDAEEDDIAVKSLDELLDEILSTNDDISDEISQCDDESYCSQVEEDNSMDSVEIASQSCPTSDVATPAKVIRRSNNESGQFIDNTPPKKRSNQQIKESALFEPLEHIYSHR